MPVTITALELRKPHPPSFPCILAPVSRLTLTRSLLGVRSSATWQRRKQLTPRQLLPCQLHVASKTATEQRLFPFVATALSSLQLARHRTVLFQLPCATP